MDVTWTLPAIFLEGNQCYFIIYNYDQNYIFTEPITNLHNEIIVSALEKIYMDLKENDSNQQ